jgi:hypothetical protein
MKIKQKFILPFSIPVKTHKGVFTFEVSLPKKVINNFPKLTKNEKRFIEDVKNYEESLIKECDHMGLPKDKVKELIWVTIKELQKDGIATDKEIKTFLKVRPEYLEFV